MDKTDLHRLIDQLPRESLQLVARFVESLLAEEDPVARALDEAPEDDEPVTEEDIAAIKAGEEDARHGRLIADEDLWAELEAEGYLGKP